MAKLTTPWKVDWGRVRYFTLAAVLSALLTPILQPKFHENKDALSVLVNVFAILAGFMVAVMTIAGDARALRGRNWREDVKHMQSVRNELFRHRALFQIYLSILVLAFLIQIRPICPDWIFLTGEYILIFLSIVAILLSFRLPHTLTDRHLKFIDDCIRERRSKEREEGGPRS